MSTSCIRLEAVIRAAWPTVFLSLALGVPLKGQPSSPNCTTALNSVATQQKTISAFEATRNSPEYAGGAITVYTTRLQQLQTELTALQTAAQMYCSPLGGVDTTFDIRPPYMILTVVYAPPGTAGGKGTSYVEYSGTNSTGSTVSTARSFKEDYSITAALQLGSDSNGVTASLGADWNDTVSNKTEVSITASSKLDLKVQAPGTDGINHDEDHIYLWLNPIVHVTARANAISYSVGVDGPSMDIQYVYPPWMRPPYPIPADVAAHLNARGMTADDYQQIVQADPFAVSSNAPINPGRFIPTSMTFPFEPPLSSSDGSSTYTYTLTSDSSTKITESTESQNSLELKVTVKAGLSGFASLTLTNDDKWTWTYDNETVSTTSSESAATAAVGDPSSAYTGPTDIAVYFDSVFHSFLFVPQSTSSLFLQGVATDAGGRPAIHQKAALSLSGHNFITWTDNRGQYRFYGRPAELGSLSGTLSIGTTKQNVAVNGQLTQINLRLK